MGDMSNPALIEHVRNHVSYPATKVEILKGCETGEFPEDVQKMEEDHLTEKTYNSADEVLKDMHIM